MKKLINVRDLVKDKIYVNPNTNSEFIFSKHEKTEKNIFAVDTKNNTHISENFIQKN
jgi:hypothetical protein